MKERTIGNIARVRGQISKSGLMVPNVLGLREGFITREKSMVGLFENLQNGYYVDSKYHRQLSEISMTSHMLPHPFWLGIHPTIMKELMNNLNSPDSNYWDTPVRQPPLPVKSLPVTLTEFGIDKEVIDPQVKFLLKYLPRGSLNHIFVSGGENSFWRRVPFVKVFAQDTHQMSLPATKERRGRGFNMLLLTETSSKTIPDLWKNDKAFSLEEWVNLHEIGHCVTIPTCWEYIDRTYSLLTPKELLDLTVARNKCLAKWHMSYGMNVGDVQGNTHPANQKYEPDSTSYLYEVKIIQRANYLAKNRKIEKTNSLPEKLYWFRGFHLDQVCEQLSLDKFEVMGAITEMNNYWMNNRRSSPTDSILNSAVYSTDIGTHPAEEVCIDILALTIAGKLPEKFGYWQEWTSKVIEAWQRWEKMTDFSENKQLNNRRDLLTSTSDLGQIHRVSS